MDRHADTSARDDKKNGVLYHAAGGSVKSGF